MTPKAQITEEKIKTFKEADEAENFLQQTPDWIISDDGIRIRKDWKVKNFMAAMDFFNKE